MPIASDSALCWCRLPTRTYDVCLVTQPPHVAQVANLCQKEDSEGLPMPSSGLWKQA